MIPELCLMLEKMRQGRAREPKDTSIVRMNECQKRMDRAAKIVGMERITHHDLRHLFATICIESSMDVSAVCCNPAFPGWDVLIRIIPASSFGAPSCGSTESCGISAIVRVTKSCVRILCLPWVWVPTDFGRYSVRHAY